MNHHSNRDLLVLFSEAVMSQKTIEKEIEWLHTILYDVERLPHLISCHELIDVNKYRIIKKSLALRTFFKERQHKPFVFLNCKN